MRVVWMEEDSRQRRLVLDDQPWHRDDRGCRQQSLMHSRKLRGMLVVMR